jgi:small subunit ribosomal protein S17
MTPARGRYRHLRGVVLSDRAAKTITVEVTRSFRHPKYGKMVRMKRRFHAHDESRQAHVGDTVEIVECRPLSRTKRWRLVRVVEKGAEEIAIVVPESLAPVTPAQ